MDIILTRQFKDDIKFYKRRKKYLKIDADIKPAVNELRAGNFIGDKLEGLPIPANTAAYGVRQPHSDRRADCRAD